MPAGLVRDTDGQLGKAVPGTSLQQTGELCGAGQRITRKDRSMPLDLLGNPGKEILPEEILLEILRSDSQK